MGASIGEALGLVCASRELTMNEMAQVALVLAY